MPKTRRRLKVTDNDIALEDLMTQLLISKAFARFEDPSEAVAAAIQLCCELVPHVANVNAPAQWN